MEAPGWQIEGLIPESSLTMIFGPEGSHKTFLAMDMSCCIATGTPFHGREVKQGRVLYVAAEGGTPIAKRLRSWEAAHTKFVDDNNLTLIMEPLILDDDAEVEDAINQLLLDAEPYSLIVFDTLNMCMLGNESSPHEVAKVVRAAKRFSATFKSTVLIIHHTPKENPNTHRGSGALSAALTTNIKVFYDGERCTSASCVKQKDHEAFETMVFSHHVIGESLVMEELDYSCDLAMANLNKVASQSYEDSILRIVRGYANGITKKDLVTAARDGGMSQSTAYRVIDRLERKRSLKSTEDGIFTIP